MSFSERPPQCHLSDDATLRLDVTARGHHASRAGADGPTRWTHPSPPMSPSRSSAWSCWTVPTPYESTAPGTSGVPSQIALLPSVARLGIGQLFERPSGPAFPSRQPDRSRRSPPAPAACGTCATSPPPRTGWPRCRPTAATATRTRHTQACSARNARRHVGARHRRRRPGRAHRCAASSELTRLDEAGRPSSLAARTSDTPWAVADEDASRGGPGHPRWAIGIDPWRSLGAAAGPGAAASRWARAPHRPGRRRRRAARA